LGANSCPQTSSHSLWERIYLPLVPCTRLPWAWPSSWVVSIPRASLGQQGHFTSQVALHWRYYYGLEATFLFSLLPPRIIGIWGLPTASLPLWSFLPMRIGERHCDCLTLVTLGLGDALSGRRLDLAMPSPRRRLTLATLPFDDALPRRCLHLASPHLGGALCWLGPRRWLWPWLCQRPDTERYTLNIYFSLSLPSLSLAHS